MDAHAKRFRQVAIVVSTLDRDGADALLAQLPDEEAASVRRAVLALADVSAAEQAAALEAFVSHSNQDQPRQSRHRRLDEGGVELDSGLAARLKGNAGEATPRDRHEPPIFQCLHEVDSQTLARLLQSEHPQTVAVIVSHLPQAQAAQLVAALPKSLQVDVMRRLADLDETDRGSLREIERHLERWLSEHWRHHQRRAAGMQTVRSILAAADPQTRSRILAELQPGGVRPNKPQSPQTQSPQTQSPQTQVLHSRVSAPAHDLKHTIGIDAADQHAEQARAAKPRRIDPTFTFDTLVHLPERSLRVLLRESEPEMILLALAGGSESLVQRVLAMFPQRDAATLRHALEHPGPTRLSDVAAAQQALIELAHRLADEGRIAPFAARLSMAA